MRTSVPRALALLILCCAASWTLPTAAQDTSGVVVVQPDLVLRGQGENVDTIGIWEAPVPEETLLFVSAKDNQLVEVWRYPFIDSEQEPLRHPGFAQGSVNGVAVDQLDDELYITVGDAPSSAFVFDLPSLAFKRRFIDGSRPLGSEPNCAFLRVPGEGPVLYVSSDNAISAHDAKTGEELGIREQPTDVETIFADAFHGCLYVPDENDRTGVNVYTPMGEPYLRGGTNHFGTSVFQDDAEGIWVYHMAGYGQPDDGAGYIIVSDQRSPLTDFEFFDRATWRHLGTLQLEGVGNTDGLASTQRPLPGYPFGFFCAVNDDQEVAIVAWEKVLDAMGLPLRHGAAAPADVRAQQEVPSAVPDRVILTLAGDASASAAVTWRTPLAAEETVLQWAPAVPPVQGEAGQSVRLDLGAAATTVQPAESITTAPEGEPHHYHTALIEGLAPDRAYVYRVGADGAWTEWNPFRTAAAAPETWRFLYFGDAQNDVFNHCSHVFRAAAGMAPNAAFMLFGGDLVNDGEFHHDWQGWFDASGWLIRSIPVLATPGNHEYWRPQEGAESEISGYWGPQFAFPKNGPVGLEEEVWRFDHAHATIVSLNSSEDPLLQAAWMREHLADQANRWTIVTFHHPIFSSGRGRDNAELRAAWQPVFEKLGVDLVLNGHDHTYARTPRLVGETPAPNGGPGVVYLNSVSGPKQYAFGDLHAGRFARTGESTQLVQLVTVSRDALAVESRLPDGTLYDAFALRRDGAGAVSYVETPVNAPERRRPVAAE